MAVISESMRIVLPRTRLKSALRNFVLYVVFCRVLVSVCDFYYLRAKLPECTNVYKTVRNDLILINSDAMTTVNHSSHALCGSSLEESLFEKEIKMINLRKRKGERQL